jgi:DNA-binding PadR family transcriptional regulator
MSELSPFSYVVLVLVGDGGAAPHDLVRMARQGRVYWDAADSQWYAEPKRLEQLGYLRSEKRPGRTRERTHYLLTDRAREALRVWVRQPIGFPRIQHEAVCRLLAADVVQDDAAVLAGLETLRTDLDDIDARIEQAEALAATLPRRERYLRLNHRLARRLVDAHRDWLDEVEQALRPRRRRR